LTGLIEVEKEELLVFGVLFGLTITGLLVAWLARKSKKSKSKVGSKPSNLEKLGKPVKSKPTSKPSKLKLVKLGGERVVYENIEEHEIWEEPSGVIKVRVKRRVVKTD